MSDLHAPAAAAVPVAGLLAEFTTPVQLLAAARRVRDAGYTRWDAHSPYHVHGLEEAMGLKPTRLPWVVSAAGVSGLAFALLLQWYTNALDYPLIVSGKPLFSLPANIPVMFELTVLFSAGMAFVGVLAVNRLPELHHPLFASARFRRASRDRFFIALDAADARFEARAAEELLRGAGAGAVEVIRDDGRPARLPRAFILGGTVLAALSLVPLMLIAQRRATPSSRPRPRLFPEMATQPRYRTQGESPFFTDHRADRLPVPGTVARGELQADDAFYRGKSGAKFVDRIPMPVTPALMKRGQERFGIYCAACHGLAGAGDGMVSKRAESFQEGTWVTPVTLYSEPVCKQTVGELFGTVTAGVRKMPAYGLLLPVEDRWAILLYVRALQRAQNARLEDVPEEIRPEMK